MTRKLDSKTRCLRSFTRLPAVSRQRARVQDDNAHELRIL
jgi:hypothetical protein